MPSKIIFAASILSADFARLGDESRDILNAGATVIHFDVMDHHFVPNLTFGALVCDALRKNGMTAQIDVHLMVTDPEEYIAPFAKAGANRLTFHPVVTKDPITLCKKIHDAGMQAGIAFNPDKEIIISDKLFSEIDLILIMSVFAGFGGQQFMPSSLEKIKKARALIKKNNQKILLGVDGGINEKNIADIANAGANFIVMGTALFHSENYAEKIKLLHAILEEKSEH